MNGTNEKTWMEKLQLGNLRQTIYIRSQNFENPVLLFLHGGPGLPEFGGLKNITRNLENKFTIVHWDQRGAGYSFSKRVSPELMNINSIVEDTHQLVLYLLKRFRKQKLFLVGHSWGTCVGLRFTDMYPELLYAYIGISQVINRRTEEILSYEFALNAAKTNKNHIARYLLAKIGRPVNGRYKSLFHLLVQRFWVSFYKGFIYKRTLYLPILSQMFLIKEYSLKGLYLILKGLKFSIRELWDDFADSNFDNLKNVKAPVYFIMGENDGITFIDLTKKFLNSLNTPHKEIFIISEASHMCIFEKPDYCTEIINRISGIEGL